MQARLTALMRLPWTIHVKRDEEDGSLVAQVAEVPDAIGTGADSKHVAKDLWESLYASLEMRLEHGDEIPLPEGVAAPWSSGAEPPSAPEEIVVGQSLSGLIVRPRASVAA